MKTGIKRFGRTTKKNKMARTNALPNELKPGEVFPTGGCEYAIAKLIANTIPEIHRAAVAASGRAKYEGNPRYRSRKLISPAKLTTKRDAPRHGGTYSRLAEHHDTKTGYFASDSPVLRGRIPTWTDAISSPRARFHSGKGRQSDARDDDQIACGFALSGADSLHPKQYGGSLPRLVETEPRSLWRGETT